MRRFLRIVIGFVTAMLAAGVSVVSFALPPSELVAMDEAARASRLIEMGGLVLRSATHSAIFSAGFALIAIVIAEWQNLREWTYYAVVGIIIASGGFLAQYASENAVEPTILNNYALIAFMTTGAVGGLVYWMISGRHAGRRRPPARLRVAEEPADTVTADDDDTRQDAGKDADLAGTDTPGDHEPDGSGVTAEGEPKAGAASDQPSQEAGQSAAETPNAPAAAATAETTRPQTSGGDAQGTGETARQTAAKQPPAPAGPRGGVPTAQPMTSVPQTRPRLAVKPRLKVAGSVPDSGPSKPSKT